MNFEENALPVIMSATDQMRAMLDELMGTAAKGIAQIMMLYVKGIAQIPLSISCAKRTPTYILRNFLLDSIEFTPYRGKNLKMSSVFECKFSQVGALI